MKMKIWGNKAGQSVFEMWSIIHAGFYAFLSSSIEAAYHPRWFINVIWVLSLTTVWELFETFAEKKWPAKWSNTRELWFNRWIGDPISNSSGAAFGIFVVLYYQGLL
jgi:hypothetical protein